MKNFRKVLALVLVVATLFSFVAMTASAKTYTDGDKVSYTEAVDVLSAIGILEGYPDGSFKPSNTIKRSEMAKMVAVLSNAGDDIEDLYASACKFADMNGNAVWAKSYVAYCNEMGIVAGRNATTFDPEGKVTGIETAKMLLCLIGFDAKAQGYVGTNWKTHVLADAKNMGLLAGFAADYEADKAITREEAAQMMLNALQAPMVIGTLSSSIVNITNNVWLDAHGKLLGVGINHVTLADAAKQYGWYVLYGNVVVSPEKVYTNYKGLNVKVGYDCYMNPVTEWTYSNAKGTEIWKSQYALTPDFSDTKAVDFKTLLKEERESKMHDYVAYLYVDGFLRSDYWKGVKLNTLTDGTWDALADLTGKGVLTNVFVDDVHHTVIITIKNTYIDVVQNTTKASNMFTLSHNTNYKGYNAFSNKDYGFETGDIILYWICNEGLHDAKLATPVTTTATRATTVGGDPAQSTVVAGGKTYEYAFNFDTKIGSNEGVMGNLNANFDYSVSYDLYLDEYGYIMYWEVTPTATEYKYAYFVEDSGHAGPISNDGAGNPVRDYTADLWDFTATFKDDAAVDRDIYDLTVAGTNTQNVGILIEYTEDANGTLEFSRWATRANDGSYLSKAGDLYDANDNVVVYNTDSTQYLVRTWDYTNGKYVYTTFNGKDGLDRAYSDHTYTSTGTDRTISTIQYFTKTATAAGQQVLSYVFIDAVYEISSVNAFVLGYKMSVSDVNFSGLWGAYDAYEAVVGGVKGLLMLTDEQARALAWNDEDTAALYKVDLASIGYSEEAGLPVYALAEGQWPTTWNREQYRYEDGRLFVGSSNVAYNVAKDAIIVAAVPTSTGKTLEIITVDKLNDYVETLRAGQLNPNSDIYITVAGWMVTDGNKTVTELYIDYSTIEIAAGPIV